MKFFFLHLESHNLTPSRLYIWFIIDAQWFLNDRAQCSAMKEPFPQLGGRMLFLLLRLKENEKLKNILTHELTMWWYAYRIVIFVKLSLKKQKTYYAWMTTVCRSENAQKVCLLLRFWRLENFEKRNSIFLFRIK